MYVCMYACHLRNSQPRMLNLKKWILHKSHSLTTSFNRGPSRKITKYHKHRNKGKHNRNPERYKLLGMTRA